MKKFSRGRFGFSAARQCGAAAIEFVLVCSLLFTLLFGMMEMARMLFYWNSAVEATRYGARMAVVCDLDDAGIKTKMRTRLTILPISKIQIQYEPAGCTVDTCQAVTVSILSGVAVTTFIPYVPLTLTLPPFSTTLPRESMLSVVNGIANPVCS